MFLALNAGRFHNYKALESGIRKQRVAQFYVAQGDQLNNALESRERILIEQQIYDDKNNKNNNNNNNNNAKSSNTSEYVTQDRMVEEVIADLLARKREDFRVIQQQGVALLNRAMVRDDPILFEMAIKVMIHSLSFYVRMMYQSFN